MLAPEAVMADEMILEITGGVVSGGGGGPPALP